MTLPPAGEGDTGNDALPDWMCNHTAQQAAEEHAQRETRRAERLKRAKLKLAAGQGAFNARTTTRAGAGAPSGASRLPASCARPPGGKGADASSAGEGDDELARGEERFLLDAWDSGGEEQPPPGAKRKPAGYASLRTCPCRDGADEYLECVFAGVLACLDHSAHAATQIGAAWASAVRAAAGPHASQGMPDDLPRFVLQAGGAQQ